MHPGSGVSPLFSVVLLFLGLCGWANMQLRRLRFKEVASPKYPPLGTNVMLPGAEEPAKEAQDAAEREFLYWWEWVVATGLLGTLMLV